MSLAWRHTRRSHADQRSWALAWPISIALHLLAFLVLYFVFTPVSDPLADSNAIREVRFAKPNETLQDRPIIRSHSAPPLSSLLTSLPTADLPSPGIPSQMGQGTRIIGLTSGQNSAGALAVFSTAPQPGPPRVSFFGSSAAGYKIVFLVDRSGSMWDQFEFVRKELVSALARLGPSQRFQLIFFSSGQPLLMKPSDFLPASPDKKKLAYDFLQTIARLDPVSGSTDPTPALRTALSLPSGPADVIFLLTDGDFPPAVLQAVKAANPNTRTQINTIGFGYQGGSQLLRDLAQANRGSFRFVKASNSPDQPTSDLESLMP